MSATASFIASDEETNQRLEQVLAQRFPSLGKNGAKRALAGGRILIDGRVAKKTWRLRVGQRVELTTPAEEAAPEPRIVQELDGWLILDKPAGLPSVPLRGHAGPSVSRWLEQHGRALPDDFDAGLIHRLDTMTSGLLLAAQTQALHQSLRALLQEKKLTKVYWALSDRAPAQPHGEIKTGLSARGRGAVRCSDEGTQFITEYRTLARFSGGYLIEARASAAYRHQVRAHLAHLGAPLLGDLLYGGTPLSLSKSLDEARAQTGAVGPEGPGKNRHALACVKIAWPAFETAAAASPDERAGGSSTQRPAITQRPAGYAKAELADDLRALVDDDGLLAELESGLDE